MDKKKENRVFQCRANSSFISNLAQRIESHLSKFEGVGLSISKPLSYSLQDVNYGYIFGGSTWRQLVWYAFQQGNSYRHRHMLSFYEVKQKCYSLAKETPEKTNVGAVVSVKDRIMIEFKLKMKSERKDIETKIIDFGFVPAKTSLLQVYKLEELIRQKLDAVSNRTLGNDIYDLYYLLDFKKKLKISKKIKQMIIKKLEEAINSYIMIQNSMNHYIAKSKRPDWRSFILELKEKIEKI